MENLAKKSCADRKIRVDLCGQAVEYAFYDCEDGTETVYFANVAWNDPTTVPKVVISTDTVLATLPVPLGTVGILRRFGDLLTYTCDQTTEVLSVERRDSGIFVTVQGEDQMDFRLITPVSLKADVEGMISCGKSLLHIQIPGNGLTKMCFSERRE